LDSIIARALLVADFIDSIDPKRTLSAECPCKSLGLFRIWVGRRNRELSCARRRPWTVRRGATAARMLCCQAATSMTLFTADVAVRGSFLATKDCHKTRQL